MLRRRDLLVGLAAVATGCGTPPRAGSRAAPSSARPVAQTPWGVATGDITETSAVVWTRADRDARLGVSWRVARDPSGRIVRAELSPATESTDHTAKARLEGLPPGERILFELDTGASGAFTTPEPADARAPRDVVFAWSGDVNGQGFGIGPTRDMPAFEALCAAEPAFFLHLGDAIYADDPIPPVLHLPGGGTWENVVTEAKSHVAQTLDDYRGAFLYPRLSPLYRAASASIPFFHLWDDHEVRDNWWSGQALDDARYAERSIDVLATRARRAMYEHTPTLRDASAPMYRSFRWGPHLEVFLLDGRSHRTPNQPEPAEERFFGEAQIAWLEDALSRSRATWKVVASDMPISLSIAEPRKGGGLAWDGIASEGRAAEHAAPHGREKEIARLLSTLRARGVDGLVWLGADVHYACIQRLDPARAAFRDFTPFHELVAGPMHAAAFPQKALDPTFGPEVLWSSAGPDTFGSPVDGLQTFGLARVDGRTGAMTVRFVDASGRTLHEHVLTPPRA